MRGEFFVAHDVPTKDLIVIEGKILIVHPSAISELWHELTPVTAMTIESFRNGSRD